MITHGFTGIKQGTQVRLLVIVNGCRYSHNIKTGCCQVVRICGKSNITTFKRFGGNLIAGIYPFFHQANPVGFDVKTNHLHFSRQLQCNR